METHTCYWSAARTGEGTRGTGMLVLGDLLRPIVLGAPPPELTALGGSGRRPEVVLSAHAPSGDMLGYAVIDRAVPGATRGGLTVSERLTLSDAVLLARTTTLQLSLCGLRGGVHHCVLTHAAKGRAAAGARRAFLKAVEPLSSAGLLDLDYTSDGRGAEPVLAHESLVASAAAAALGALEHLALEPRWATFVLREPTRLAREVGRALETHGLHAARCISPSSTDADVAVIDGPPRPIRLEEALPLRARIVLVLSTRAFATAAERMLHDRGAVVVPDTLATLGRTVALDLHQRGLDARGALLRSAARVHRLTASLLETAAHRAEPLPAVVRTAVDD